MSPKLQLSDRALKRSICLSYRLRSTTKSEINISFRVVRAINVPEFNQTYQRLVHIRNHNVHLRKHRNKRKYLSQPNLKFSFNLKPNLKFSECAMHKKPEQLKTRLLCIPECFELRKQFESIGPQRKQSPLQKTVLLLFFKLPYKLDAPATSLFFLLQRFLDGAVASACCRT